jgi:orotidine-5'-phosphate decarboxylase
MMNMDRLYEAVDERGPVCVGLDTAPEYLPPRLSRGDGAEHAALAVLRYNQAIIEATSDAAACFKVQIAYYEALGLAGLHTYAQTLRALRERGALVIADIKRGDIAETAARYAAAHFSGDFEADFVTLSPFLGLDSLEPWLAWADRAGKGAFVLLRTSNPGMRDFQNRELKEGGRLYEELGLRLGDLMRGRRGIHGYGAFGAVVGCTQAEASDIRERHGDLFFLIPGYGAQGGGAAEAAALLRDGNGGVVNASRSILRAWTALDKDPQDITLDDAAQAARQAALAMRDALHPLGGPGRALAQGVMGGA